jgi:hypothetical protein
VLDEMERRDRRRERPRADRERDRNRERDRDRDRPSPQQAGNRVLLYLGGSLLGLAVLALGVGIGVATLMKTPQPPVAENGPRPNPLPDHEKPAPPKLPQPPIQPKVPIDPPIDPPEQPRPVPPTPLPKRDPRTTLPKLELKLVAGKADIPVDFPGPVPSFGNAVLRPYRVELKPRTLYWIRTQNDQVQLEIQPALTVEGAEGSIELPETPWKPSLSNQRVFETGDRGEYTLTVARSHLHRGTTRLVIKAVEDGDTLPPYLRVPAKTVELPRVTERGDANLARSSTSAAFSPDGKSLLIAGQDGVVSYWVEGKRKGAYGKPAKLINDPKRLLHAMAIDFQGRVYAQEGTGRGPLPVRQTIGDIQIWNSLTPTGDEAQLPEASRTIPLKGVVARMIASPDGKFLYFLDTHNRRIGRINAETGKIDREVHDLLDGPVTLCLTADGKRLYCCSSNSQIEVIDTAQFRYLGSVLYDQGAPSAIAATNAGLVYLIAREKVPGVFTASGPEKLFVVDLRNKLPAKARASLVDPTLIAQQVGILPDQRGVLLKTLQGVQLLAISERPGIEANRMKQITAVISGQSGNIAFSPDGKRAFVDGVPLLGIDR